MYPFVKFPMYGYSKDPSEMFRSVTTVEAIRADGSAVAVDFGGYRFGLTHDVVAKEILRPAMDGDVESVRRLVFLVEEAYGLEAARIQVRTVSLDLNAVPPVILSDETRDIMKVIR